MTTQIVGILSVAGVPGQPTFAVAFNPGNIFSVSGNQLLAPSTLSNGNYSLTIVASGPGNNITAPFVLTYTSPSPSTDGPMDFSVPGNLPESPAGAAI